MRKSVAQLVKLIRCLGWYLLVITFFYLFQTIVCLCYISINDFTPMFTSVDYAIEIFDFSVIIDKMKIVHAVFFLVISLLLIRNNVRYHTLGHRDYLFMLMITIAVTIAFLMPFLFIVYISYRDVGTS